MIFNSGDVQFYGGFEVNSILYTLDDALLLGPNSNGALYSLLTVFKRGDGPLSAELARLYRTTDLRGGSMPYHAKAEVLWSDRVEERIVGDISKEIRCATLETRRAFIARSDFPSSAFFFHSPEVYWACTEQSAVLPRQVDQRPTETKTSAFRRMLPDHAVIRAHSLKRVPIEEDICLTGSNGSHTTATETDSPVTKVDLDLTQEESQLTIDIGKSNDGITNVHRKRLRRMASVSNGLKQGDSLEFGTPEEPLVPFGESPILLDEDTNDIENIDTPPSMAIKKANAMWTLEAEDEGASPTTIVSRDRDDWISKQANKADGATSKTPKKESQLVRPSLTQHDAHDLLRTTQLSKANTRLNNYAAYATEDGEGTTKDPPKPTSNIRSFFTQSPSKSTKTKQLISTGISTIDSDGEEDEFKKQLTSSPSSTDRAALPTKTWRPPGPRQTTISFAKAPRNALDAAVLTTGSLNGAAATPSTPENSKLSSRISTTTPSSSSKKKSIMPLMVEGIAAASESKLKGAKTSSSPTKSASKSKKRLREGDDISDDDENDPFFSNLGLKLRKLANGSPSKVDDPIVTGGYDKKRRKAIDDDEDDVGVSAEMEGFIVEDDEEIEYDNKIRFIDEEPTNTDLEGYMDLDRPSAVGSHSSIDLETALMRYFQYLISSVINPSFASTYAGEGSKRDSYFSPAISKVRSQVNSIKDSLLASSVWSTELQHAVDDYPTAIVTLEKTHGGIESTCQVCRRKHTCPKIVQLAGVPYDCEAFWNGKWLDNPAEDTEPSSQSIRAGLTCSSRVIAYHQLQHLQYHLVQHIRPKVEKYRAEVENRIGKVSEDELEVELLNHALEQTSWLSELKLRVERLLDTALNFGLKVGTRTETHDDFALALHYD